LADHKANYKFVYGVYSKEIKGDERLGKAREMARQVCRAGQAVDLG